MSASYYTSYEISVALKEAGAPQGLADRAWYRSVTRHGPVLIIAAGDPAEARAFRLDEILEALSKFGHLRVQGPPDGWGVYLYVGFPEIGLCDNAETGEECSPVEAAAACWLSILRAAREVAR